MTIRELADKGIFKVVCAGDDTDREISGVFCCDLLSVVMGRGKADAAWVTVMGNINSLAVLSLTDMACIVLAEGAQMDAAGIARAEMQGFTIFATDQPIFETAMQIQALLDA
jgi:hypothetical protein